MGQTIAELRAHLHSLPPEDLEGLTASAPARELLRILDMGDAMAEALGDVGDWLDTLAAHDATPPAADLLRERIRARLAHWPGQGQREGGDLAHLVLVSKKEDGRGGYKAMWVEADGSTVDLWVPSGFVAAMDATRAELRRHKEAVEWFRDAYLRLRQEREKY